MDMYVDKYGSAVFSVEELDVLTDAMEDFLFKDFFESQNSILQMMSFNDEWGGIVVDCINPQIDSSFQSYAQSMAEDLGASLATDLRDGFFRAGLLIDQEESVIVYSMIMNFNVGTLLFYLGTDNATSFDSGKVGLASYAKLICEVLAKRDDVARQVTKSFPSDGMCLVDKKICDFAKKRIAAYLASEKQSVRIWRELYEED